VKASWSGGDKAPVLTLTSDKPAVFVTATVDVPGYFSDNAVTLLPGREVKLSFTPRKGAKVTKNALAKGLRLSHLRETY
jgi:beta-mannosidase